MLSPQELQARRAARRRAVRRRRLGALAAVLALAGGTAALATLLPDGPPGPATAAPAVLGTTAIETGAAASGPHPTETRPQPPPPPPEPPAEITIAATGDVALGKTGSLPEGGAARLFARIRRHLAADLVLGNLESTLATSGASQCGPRSRNCYAFRAPPSYAAGLARAGFTVLSVANNHHLDYGRRAAEETLAALRAAGLRHTGRPGQITVVRIGSTRVAVVGFAPYEWAQSLLDLREARRLVRRAGRRADLVVVTMHAGAEGVRFAHVRPGQEYYLGERRGDPVAFAHAVIEAGADLVAGHGPHVLRGLEWYRGRLVAYSLGNFSSVRNFDTSGRGGVSAVLRVTLRADGSWVEGSLVPVSLVGTGTPVPDRERRALGLVRALSREDFGRRAVRVSPDGDLRPPAAP